MKPLSTKLLCALLPLLTFSPFHAPALEFETPTGHWSYNATTDTYTAGDGTTKIPKNSFLATKGSYRDFEFTCEFQITGDSETGMINSGIQFHSQRIPDHHEMIGYQADIGAPGNPKWWGCLYDESRRKKILAAPEAPLTKTANSDWHIYRIRSQSGRIQLFIDDLPTVNYTEQDPTIPLHGKLALQIHSGGHTQVKFKNVQIKEIGRDTKKYTEISRLLSSSGSATLKAVQDAGRFGFKDTEPELIGLLNDDKTPKKLLVPILETLASFPSLAEDTFATLAADSNASPEARLAALEALRAIDTESAKSRIDAIAAPN